MTEIPEPSVLVTRYEVSCLPEKDYHFALTVESRRDGQWAVLDGPYPLFADGSRDYQALRGDRLDLETALALAREQAPQMEINGRTVAEVLSRRAAAEATS